MGAHYQKVFEMSVTGKIARGIIVALSAFMILDASLAMIIGEAYRYFGLEYMPEWYRRLVLDVYASPSVVIWGLMIAEFVLGILIFVRAGKNLVSLQCSELMPLKQEKKEKDKLTQNK